MSEKPSRPWDPPSQGPSTADMSHLKVAPMIGTTASADPAAAVDPAVISFSQPSDSKVPTTFTASNQMLQNQGQPSLQQSLQPDQSSQQFNWNTANGSATPMGGMFPHPQQHSMNFMEHQRNLLQSQFGSKATDILMGMNASVEGFNKLSQLVQFNLQSLHTFLSSVMQLMQRGTVLRYEIFLLFKAMTIFRILYVYRLKLRRLLYSIGAKLGLVGQRRAYQATLEYVWAKTKHEREVAERVYSTLASTVYAGNSMGMAGAPAVHPSVVWIGARSAKSGGSVLLKALVLVGASALGWWFYHRYAPEDEESKQQATTDATSGTSTPSTQGDASTQPQPQASPSTQQTSTSAPPQTPAQAAMYTQFSQNQTPINPLNMGMNMNPMGMNTMNNVNSLSSMGTMNMSLGPGSPPGFLNMGLTNPSGNLYNNMGGMGMYGWPNLGMNPGFGGNYGAAGGYGGMGIGR